MYLLGIDVGSSSVKASILEAATGRCVASAQSPDQELPIEVPRPGWAEQDPESWWTHAVKAVHQACAQDGVDVQDIRAIGIAYQMHGLVCLDDQGQVLRPSIIWCDSRAVGIGKKAFNALGADLCLEHLLNSPGNFTASKLRWVKENEPDLFKRIRHILLPGDYLAYRLTGAIRSTLSGLSEGIFWDFKNEAPATFLLDHYEIPPELIPEQVPTFGWQGALHEEAARALGLKPGTPLTYRAGDQPNNALSLNVLNAGEIAATAGTSGVVYGVSDQVKYDPQSRVNTFAHVNHGPDQTRLGVLLCVNGTGIMYAWLRRLMGGSWSYHDLSMLAEEVSIGSDGLTALTFGNGAERLLGNQEVGARLVDIDLNRHGAGHVCRAVQEGVVFAFRYGIDIMRSLGVVPDVIRAGHANMFYSPVFRSALAGVTGATIELYNTDGALGAARGAGIGAGMYASPAEAFEKLEKVQTIEPVPDERAEYEEAYRRWLSELNKALV